MKPKRQKRKKDHQRNASGTDGLKWGGTGNAPTFSSDQVLVRRAHFHSEHEMKRMVEGPKRQQKSLTIAKDLQDNRPSIIRYYRIENNQQEMGRLRPLV